MEKDKIFCMDCLEGIRQIESGTVSLIIADPPYELKNHNDRGKGTAFGRKGRGYFKEIDNLQCGISNLMLSEMIRVCWPHPNMYIFCSKDQLPQLLNFALNHGLHYDLLCWHKTNPIPTCNNKYLSDTEYIVFMRNGAYLYGTYETKHKYFITQINTADKKAWGHPTPKPVDIIQTLIENSTQKGDLVLDPYIGSGTTAVACIKSGRHYVGFEINTDYYQKACKRIEAEHAQLTLF